MKNISTITTIHKTDIYEINNSSLRVKKNYIDDKLTSIELVGAGPYKSRPVIVKESFKNFITTENPFRNQEVEIYYYTAEEMLTLDIDQAVQEGRLYYFYHSGHMLFDANQEPVSLSHYFDYIGTDFNSDTIDLDKAVEVLKNHPWVLNKEELVIKDVPYNNDSVQNKYISVKLKADVTSFKDMYKMSLNIKGREGSWSSELKDLLKGKSYAYPKFDPLDIHKFRHIK